MEEVLGLKRGRTGFLSGARDGARAGVRDGMGNCPCPPKEMTNDRNSSTYDKEEGRGLKEEGGL